MTPVVRKVKVMLWLLLAVPTGMGPKFVAAGALAVAATGESTTRVTLAVPVPG
jgi:hypothetical protein